MNTYLKSTTLFILTLFIYGRIYAQKPLKEFIYVGTFSERGSEGIYVFDFNRKSRQLQLLQTIESKRSPTFLTIHPSGKYLFSVINPLRGFPAFVVINL